MAGCCLAVPEEMDESNDRRGSSSTRKLETAVSGISLQEGLAGYATTKPVSPRVVGPTVVLPQFRSGELTTRLELYIRILNRVVATECEVALENSKAIQARAHGVCRAVIATVGCVRDMGPTLESLLSALTKEVLAIDTLSDEVVSTIQRVASEYEHRTSFASLAFLSSPEDSAEQVLFPLVVSYIRHLHTNWKALVEQSYQERMLERVLDSEMRRLFKTVEFRSIGHLLEVCQGFQENLQNIHIPPVYGGIMAEVSSEASDLDSLCSSSRAIKQALRDLQRELVTVNGHALPPATSRRELVHLLSQTLNSRALFQRPSRKSKSKSSAINKVKSCPSMIPTQELESDGFLSSGNEGDTDCSSPQKTPVNGSDKIKSRRHRGTFHLSTVDIMTRRLLLASSRTGMAGDAYFIVLDLFGGEEVEVVPTSAATQNVVVGRPRVGTIEIVVRLSSVTIKCHSSFDVYPKNLVGDCEPLIQLHTTTSETIGLQEVRAADSETGKGKVDFDSSSDMSSDEGKKFPKMMIQERKTDRTGWRTVSIRPALYEKVQEWNTPS